MAIKLNVWKAMLSGITLCLLLSLYTAPLASAQQRTFFNGGFEQNTPRGPGTATFEILDDDLVDEWTSTTDEIELWDSGFQSTLSYEGDVHAEMNANIPGTLYQEVCLIDGEEIGWFFPTRHIKRG